MVVACFLSYEGGTGETCMAGCLEVLIPCRDSLMGIICSNMFMGSTQNNVI